MDVLTNEQLAQDNELIYPNIKIKTVNLDKFIDYSASSLVRVLADNGLYYYVLVREVHRIGKRELFTIPVNLLYEHESVIQTKIVSKVNLQCMLVKHKFKITHEMLKEEVTPGVKRHRKCNSQQDENERLERLYEISN